MALFEHLLVTKLVKIRQLCCVQHLLSRFFCFQQTDIRSLSNYTGSLKTENKYCKCFPDQLRQAQWKSSETDSGFTESKFLIAALVTDVLTYISLMCRVA